MLSWHFCFITSCAFVWGLFFVFFTSCIGVFLVYIFRVGNQLRLQFVYSTADQMENIPTLSNFAHAQAQEGRDTRLRSLCTVSLQDPVKLQDELRFRSRRDRRHLR